MAGVPPLDLGDADTSGFAPIDPGRYPAEVFKATWDEIKNTSGTGKMPAGTPMLKVQFRITQEIDGSTNRRVFSQYIIPPKSYDKSKAQRMKGMLVNFLVAVGEDEEAVRSKGYEIDTEELTGRECVVVVGKEPKRTRDGDEIEGEFNNPVKGVKHIDTWTGEREGAGSLL
jgi:hypothetical protein